MRLAIAAIACLIALPANALGCQYEEYLAETEAVEFAAIKCQAHLKVYGSSAVADCVTVKYRSPSEALLMCARERSEIAVIATENGKAEAAARFSAEADALSELVERQKAAGIAVRATADTLGAEF
jgi:hypothetical protein